MSTSKLGRAEDLDAYWPREEQNRSLGRVSIQTVSIDWINGIVSSYPYEGQKKIYGEFSYELDGWEENSVSREGEYEYRVGSGLFMLNVPTNRPRTDAVINELNKGLEGSVEIEELSIDRKSIWDFFEEADDVIELTTFGDSGRQTHYALNDSIDIRNTLIEEANLAYEYEGEKVAVYYNKGRLQIPRVTDQGREFVLQLFEKHVLNNKE